MRRLPLSPRVMLAGWYKARLPVPIEALLGPLHVMHGPDFVLPPRIAAAGVVTVHDLAFATRPEDAHPAQRRFLESAVPWSIDRARLVIAVSETTRRDLMTRYGVRPHRIRVVPNAVSPEFHERDSADELAAARRRLRLPDEYLLSVGTIHPRKNLGGLARAAALTCPTAGAGAARRARRTRRLALRTRVCRRRVGRSPGHSLHRPNQRRHAARALPPGRRPGVPELCRGIWDSHIGGICLWHSRGHVKRLGDARGGRGCGGAGGSHTTPDSIAAGIVRVVQDADRRAELVRRGRRRLGDFSWTRSARQTLEVYAEARRGEPEPGASTVAANG